MTKKNIISCLILGLLFSCSSNKENASEYDKKITNAFESFNGVFMNYSMSLKNSSPETKESVRITTLQMIQSSIDSSDIMQPFGNDATYLDSYKNYLKTVRLCLRNYDSIKISLLIKDSLMDKKDSSSVKELTSQSLLNCDKAYLEFQNMQRKFREKNGINTN